MLLVYMLLSLAAFARLVFHKQMSSPYINCAKRKVEYKCTRVMLQSLHSSLLVYAPGFKNYRGLRFPCSRCNVNPL